MEILRKFFSFMQRFEEFSPCDIPAVFLGHTYALQPTLDEFKRTASILMEKNKKDLEKGVLPPLIICFSDKAVIVKDAKQRPCIEYEIRKIVVSCVDAKNKRLLAIFYHKDTTCFGANVAGKELECHLFLCRSKDKAKLAAYNIGELLAKEYELPERRLTATLEEKNISVSNAVNNEFDYENVAKFFRRNFVNPNDCDISIVTTPCDSLSTFVTTTGYDSGRASTITSRDYKNLSANNSFREHYNRSNSFKNYLSTSSSRSCSFKTNKSNNSSRSCSFKNSGNNNNSFRERKTSNEVVKKKEEIKNITNNKIKCQYSIDDDNVSGSDEDSKITSSLYINPYDNTMLPKRVEESIKERNSTNDKIKVIYSLHDSEDDNMSLSDEDSKVTTNFLNARYYYKTPFPGCILEESTEEISFNRLSNARENYTFDKETLINNAINGENRHSFYKENQSKEVSKHNLTEDVCCNLNGVTLTTKRNGEYPSKKALEITNHFFKENSLNSVNNQHAVENKINMVTDLLQENDLNEYMQLIEMHETDI